MGADERACAGVEVSDAPAVSQAAVMRALAEERPVMLALEGLGEGGELSAAFIEFMKTLAKENRGIYRAIN